MTSEEPEWEMDVEDGVVVARFHSSLDDEALEAIEERWREIVGGEDVDAHVSILATDESVGWAVLDGMSYAAKIGAEHGLQRWAVVGDGVKQLAAKNRFEVPEVDLFTTDDPDEAIEWAREAGSDD